MSVLRGMARELESIERRVWRKARAMTRRAATSTRRRSDFLARTASPRGGQSKSHFRTNRRFLGKSAIRQRLGTPPCSERVKEIYQVLRLLSAEANIEALVIEIH